MKSTQPTLGKASLCSRESSSSAVNEKHAALPEQSIPMGIPRVVRGA